jgi:hypothetical protein
MAAAHKAAAGATAAAAAAPTLSVTPTLPLALPPHTNTTQPELGIDLSAIWRRSLAILLHRLRAPVLTELDMGGALLYLAALGAVHLLVRRGV